MKKSELFSKLKIFSVVTSVGMFMACAGGSNEGNDNEVLTDTVMDQEAGNDEQKAVYYVTPSVVEIAAVIRSTEANFSSDILNSADNKKNYSTQYKRAVNMGVYGADLAYAAMFEETQTALNYLKTIKEMTDDMGMDGVFEQALLKQIQSNITNRDSLLNIISDFFWSADAYLEDNDRGEVAALMVAGGWVEATYISTDMALRSPKNQAIRDRIAEQKMIAKNLVMLMKGKLPADNTEAQSLLKKVLSIKEILDNVGLEQTTGRIVSNDETMTTDIDNSSKITMSEDALKNLHAKIKELRSELIK